MANSNFSTPRIRNQENAQICQILFKTVRKTQNSRNRISQQNLYRWFRFKQQIPNMKLVFENFISNIIQVPLESVVVGSREKPRLNFKFCLLPKFNHKLKMTSRFTIKFYFNQSTKSNILYNILGYYNLPTLRNSVPEFKLNYHFTLVTL